MRSPLQTRFSIIQQENIKIQGMILFEKHFPQNDVLFLLIKNLNIFRYLQKYDFLGILFVDVHHTGSGIIGSNSTLGLESDPKRSDE